MSSKTPVFLLLILLTAISINVSAQNLTQNLAQNQAAEPGRERLALSQVKNYVDADLKVQYSLEKNALQMINQQRAGQGLSALSWNEKAAQVARLHSENMAHYKFFNHRGLDGLMVNERADSLELEWEAIGENIAYNRGYEDPVGFTVQRWMDSPSHKDNILNRRWKETGIGIIASPDGTYYLTQVFLVQ